MSYDYAYGQDVTKAFVEHLKKLQPDIEIVDQQWPKLGEQDYTPFINAQLSQASPTRCSRRCGAAASSPSRSRRGRCSYFEAIKFHFVGAGEAGSIETAKSMGADYPLGIWANSYDVFHWDKAPPSHKDFIERLKKYTKEEHPSSWPMVGYMAMQALVAGIEKANSDGLRQGREGAAGHHLRHAARQADDPRQGPQRQPRPVLGQDGVKDPKYPFAVMSEVTYVDPLPLMD